MFKFRLLAILSCIGLPGLLACSSNDQDSDAHATTDASTSDSSTSDGSVTDVSTSDSSTSDGSTDGSVTDGSVTDADEPGDAEQEADVTQPPPGPVKYLGYFASSFDGHGEGDYSLDTAAAGANLTFIRAGLSTLGPKLTVAKTAKQKAVVLIQDHIFNWTGGLSLRPDWQEQWDAIASILESGHEDTVVAIYPIDEPYWNGYLNGVAESMVRDWLIEVVTAVRQRFPTKAVGTILAIPALETDLGSSYVDMFDWVGFDCYGPWENCWGHSMDWYANRLGSWLTADQRMMSVPEAFLWGKSGTDLPAQHTIVTRLNQWHKLVISDPRYIGVVPFLWPSMDLDGDGLIDTGAKDLPWVKERVYQMAASLLHPEQSRVFPVDETASSSYSTSLPFAATDRDDVSSWNAGGPAPQWISFDLGEVKTLQRIELLTLQSPAGETTHVIEGSLDGTSWFPVGTLSGMTDGNQLLQWTGSTSARWVRVTTTKSPSWVGWHEIRFFK
jgi:hypothetical protein